MRLAAFQSWYPSACFAVRHDDLSSVFDFIPRLALPLVRQVSLTITPGQCYLWPGRPPSWPHPQWSLEWLERSCGFSSRLSRPTSPSEDLRAALEVLATGGDEQAPSIALEMDLNGTYEFAGVFDGLEGVVDDSLEERFSWTYDLYLDVAHAVYQAFGKPGRRRLGEVHFLLGTFRDLEPWLAREVLGDLFTGSVERPAEKGRARTMSDKVPPWHSMEYVGGGRKLDASSGF